MYSGNLLPHHRFHAVLPSCDIKGIAYVYANKRAESLTFTSSFSCFSSNVHHCLDSVHSETFFSTAELVLRETVIAHHITRSGLTGPGVFLLVTNPLETFLYDLPQSYFSCFPCLMQQIITLERVYFRRAVRYLQRRVEHWSLHQYIKFLERLCPRPGFEWSYDATTFRHLARALYLPTT